MAIESLSGFTVSCDVCGESFGDDHGQSQVFETEDDLKAEINKADWTWDEETREIFCSLCTDEEDDK